MPDGRGSTIAIKRGFVETSRGQIHYRVAGEGKPLILLHPSPFSSRRFIPLLPLMGARRRVYALDTPGYGESYRPSTRPTIRDYGDAVAEAIAGLGYDSAPLYGDLTGSMVALATAGYHPERVSALALGVIAYYTPNSEESAPRRLTFPTMLQMTPPAADGSDFRALFRRMIERGVHTAPGKPVDPQRVTTWVLERMQMLEAGCWGFEAVYTHTLDEVMRNISCPILVAATETHGNEVQIARGRAILPGYELVQGPRSFQIEDVRDFLAEAIPDFLDRQGV